mgnify:CR=1 FL=1
MVEINCVYTKTGDDGTTSLGNGNRTNKDAIRVEAMGTLDELNAQLGLVACLLHDTGGFPELTHQVGRIQNQCFNLGAELAMVTQEDPPSCPCIKPEDLEQLENEIDERNRLLAPLTSFILPGGSQMAARLHICRTVCRRTERRFISLHREENLRSINLKFLNRLSDWLFVMSRFVLQQQHHTEKLWQPS